MFVKAAAFLSKGYCNHSKFRKKFERTERSLFYDELSSRLQTLNESEYN